MKSYYIESDTPFSDNQMKFGWIKRQFKIPSDAIVGFRGSFHSQTIKEEAETAGIPIPYYFEDMLHIFIQHKSISLQEAKSRLLILGLLANQILGEGFNRDGSIIYFNHEQLNLTSIRHNLRAGMIHMGFFLSSETQGTPIVGLENFDIPTKKFAIQLMQHYCKDLSYMEI